MKTIQRLTGHRNIATTALHCDVNDRTSGVGLSLARIWHIKILYIRLLGETGLLDAKCSMSASLRKRPNWCNAAK